MGWDWLKTALTQDWPLIRLPTTATLNPPWHLENRMTNAPITSNSKYTRTAMSPT